MQAAPQDDTCAIRLACGACTAIRRRCWREGWMNDAFNEEYFR